MSSIPSRPLLAGFFVLAAWAVPARAQEPVRLREQFPPGYVYQVSSRVDLSGSLSLPPEKGQTAGRSLAVTGNSRIDYEERILTASADGQVQKTARVYRRMDFQRKVGTQQEQNSLRPAVRRLVVLRHNNIEVPFSPDGPLLWGEIDLVRTDVFTPALQGLLADRPVRSGERWNASTAAILELTDMVKLEEGGLGCRLDGLTEYSGRRYARVSFAGTVRGQGEDGPTRQELDGFVLFDLQASFLSYLSLRGVQTLLDSGGKAAGKVEGVFVLTRRPVAAPAELSDAALRGLALEPSAQNTLLLYDNPDLAVRFLYPRRWRVAGVHGRQLAVDESRGSGLLLTVEPPARVPTGEQYLQESRAYLQQQKAKVLQVEPARLLLKGPPAVEQFALELELGGQRARMEYYVVRDVSGGATVAARLLPADLPTVQQELRQIVQSLRITRRP
jgi:hypothetical protein